MARKFRNSDTSKNNATAAKSTALVPQPTDTPAVRPDFTVAVYKGVSAASQALGRALSPKKRNATGPGPLKRTFLATVKSKPLKTTGRLMGAGLKTAFNRAVAPAVKVFWHGWIYATGGKRIDKACREMGERPRRRDERFLTGMVSMYGGLMGAIILSNTTDQTAGMSLLMALGGVAGVPILTLQTHSILHTGKIKTKHLERVAREQQYLEDLRKKTPKP